jgi:hypothetical protein
MVNVTTGLVRQSAGLLLLAAGCLLSANTFAATPLQYYVAIQPIVVCSTTGTGCAPFNTSSKIGNPGGATSTTPIGFVDTASGKDVTRAIWNQVGIEVAWSPLRQ